MPTRNTRKLLAFVATAIGAATVMTVPAPAGAIPLFPQDIPPINSVTLTFKRADLFTINAIFTNKSDVTGHCNYDAQGVDGAPGGKTDDFGLSKKATVTRQYPAPLPGTTYHVKLSCVGSVDASPTQFGFIDQDFGF